ncbi:MAG TPA: hypothetical protein VGZ22_30360 [Isosphaeraceae bacterium]|jgi:hypothetical protein|nr:hypothetical protein [Isosphaeraceae bacterium]
MLPNRAILLTVALSLCPAAAWAQESYSVLPLKEAPPAALASPIKAVLNAQGYRVVDDQGKTVADFWLRKAVPASGKPAGPKETILYPVLAEGELLGALRYPADGHDYRDQTINAGVYTLRYGLQPVNGDHLGVSPYRDFACLLLASKDTALADLSQKKLENQSAEAAGSSHPAVLMLLAPPPGSKGELTIVHDDVKNTWGAVVPLTLAVKGQTEPATLPVQLVLVGAAMP